MFRRNFLKSILVIAFAAPRIALSSIDIKKDLKKFELIELVEIRKPPITIPCNMGEIKITPNKQYRITIRNDA